MDTIILIVVLIAVLAVLILVHEFGHFWIAKRNGIRVDEFGFGFPPRAKKLFNWKGTEFTLNWLPFGGFVKIFGENPDDPELLGGKPKDSFIAKSRWVQAKVLFAGVVFNMILAWLLFSVAYFAGTAAVLNSDSSLYKHMGPNQELMVTEVLPGSPAGKADLAPGDMIKNVSELGNDRPYPNLDDQSFSSFIKDHQNEKLVISYERDGRENSILVTPMVGVVSQDYASIGVGVGLSGEVKLPVHKAVWRGVTSSVKIFADIISGLGAIIKDIFVKSDTSVLSQVSGPVGIAGIVKDAMSQGFTAVLMLVGIISINLAVLNLLPFPALDGGRLMVLPIEKIRNKKLNSKVIMWINAVGFIVLIGLMIIVTISDIIKI